MIIVNKNDYSSSVLGIFVGPKKLEKSKMKRKVAMKKTTKYLRLPFQSHAKSSLLLFTFMFLNNSIRSPSAFEINSHTKLPNLSINTN